MSFRERLERLNPRVMFGWSLVVAGLLGCFQLQQSPWGLTVSYAILAAGWIVLLLPSGVRLWAENRWRFARRPPAVTSIGVVNSAPTLPVHNSYSGDYFSQIPKERQRELLDGLLVNARDLPESMPDDAWNVWQAFRNEGLMILGRIYPPSSQHLRAFANVWLISSAAVRMDTDADWRRGRQEYIDCLKVALQEIELFG